MNILFLTLNYISDISQKGMYTDMLRVFMEHGNNIYISCPVERRRKLQTICISKHNVHILNIKTLNIQKTNILEKGIGTILLEKQFSRAIEKYWGNVHFDLLIYSTPPITFNKVISSIKKRCNAKSYLLLKDIFPQNAVDLNFFSKNSFIYKYFRRKEQKLYQLSDYIGCMSPANVEYIIKNNSSICRDKIEVCPNCIELSSIINIEENEKLDLLMKYEISTSFPIFIYGGNLGKPQGLNFLLEVIKENETEPKAFFLVVGNGTEYPKILKWFNKNAPKNSRLLSALPKSDYKRLVQLCDVGLIFLDKRFTIPNFPSRLLSYLEYKMPVLLATDRNTDIGRIAESNGFGYWCENGDVSSFMRNVSVLSNNKDLRKTMGENGFKYLAENFTVEKACNIISNHFD